MGQKNIFYVLVIVFPLLVFFLFLVMIMAPFHPINSMSWNYCLREKNMGELKNSTIICYILDLVPRSGHKNRSWRISEDTGCLSNSQSEEFGKRKEVDRRPSVSRGQGTRTRESDLSDDADSRDIGMQGPSHLQLDNHTMSAVPQSHVEARKSPTDHHISIPGKLVHCLYEAGSRSIVLIGIKKGLSPIFARLPANKSDSHLCPETLPSNITYVNSLYFSCSGH